MSAMSLTAAVAISILLLLAQQNIDVNGVRIEDCPAEDRDMCSDNSLTCIQWMKKNYVYIEGCRGMDGRQPAKSAHVPETLRFKPSDEMIHTRLPPNWTYSVYRRNYDSGALTPVQDCCDMTKNDLCPLPAPDYDNEQYIAIFPFKRDDNYTRYCTYVVEYDDVPVVECVEGREIINPCLVFENGEYTVRYKYEPSSPNYRTQKLQLDKCYFTLPNDAIPQDLGLKVDETVQMQPGFITIQHENGTEIASVGNASYPCVLHQGIDNLSAHENIYRNDHNEHIGDYVCYGVKLPSSDNYLKRALCTRVVDTDNQALDFSAPVLPIVIAAAIVLGILVVFVGVTIYRRHGNVRDSDKNKKKDISFHALKQETEDSPC